MTEWTAGEILRPSNKIPELPELSEGLRWKIINQESYDGRKTSDYLHMQKRTYHTKLFSRKVVEVWSTIHKEYICGVGGNVNFSKTNYPWSVENAAENILKEIHIQTYGAPVPVGRDIALCVVNDDCD